MLALKSSRKGSGSRVTIRDVARAAGVSITTVSHVLNNRRELPEKTKKAIFDAVEEVGYRVNSSARSLRTGVTGIISLTFRPHNAVHGSLNGTEYHLRLAGAAAAAAIDRGFGIVQLPVHMLMEGTIPTDGCIIVAPFGNDQILTKAIKRRMLVVTADPDPDRKDLAAFAGRDEEPGMRELLDHLAEKGCKDIWLVIGEDDNSWKRNSERIYREWTAERVVRRTLFPLAETSGYAGAAHLAERLFAERPLPDAIITATSPFAAGFATIAMKSGLSIPGDLKIAALSDSEIARTFNPPITALDLQPEVIGRACVDLLCDMIDGNKPGTLITRSILRRRLSTGEG